VTYDGRDVTTAIDIRSGQKVENVMLTFTDKVTEINARSERPGRSGAGLHRARVFDRQLTLAAQSRQIQTARPIRPGSTGSGTAGGDYYIVTVDPASRASGSAGVSRQHRSALARQLGDGDTKTQDFKIRSQRNR